MTALPALHQRCGAGTLLVMLPGALMTPQHMVDAGLFEAVRQRRLALDLMAPDLHALQACNRDALERLDQDVMAPARAAYRQVWLGGISRGGQLALSYLAERSPPPDGLCLLAPYPGSRLTTNAIARAGGLDVWQANAEQLQDPEFRVWQWLRQPGWQGPTFVGYGEQDRFADGMRQLVDRLPQARFETCPGGHDWVAWLPLWECFLDQCGFEVQP